MLFTRGFVDAIELAEHFYKHVTLRHEFPVATEAEYQELADRFLGGDKDADTLECYRIKRDGSRGDMIRYNTRTEEYGILSMSGVIRSYFIADPSTHRMGSNLDYFRWDCRRRKD